VPLEVNTFPDVPGATVCGAEVPLPKRTLLAVNVAAPVPPWATVNGVVSPVKEVISELAPLLAAVKFPLAVVVLSTSERLFVLTKNVEVTGIEAST